ncbi:MAG TPA: cupredoxin domain-containing protein [Anaerolineales bacterium]|nr:cupredoxin domain-containing protein [Anaerolineales bacterium]
MLKKILLSVVSLIVLSACSAQQAKPSTDVTVEMTDFAYSPSSITVPVDQPVTFTIKNTGNIEHDFVVEEIDATSTLVMDSGSETHHAHGEEQNYDLHVSAGTGEESVFQLTIIDPGTYKVFCSVEGHEAAGMVGELIVLDQQ